jgi:hypothetical protein
LKTKQQQFKKRNMQISCTLIVAIASIAAATAFAPCSQRAKGCTELTAEPLTRRSILTTVATGLSTASILAVSGSQPAFAEVAKGDSLPEGAAQFKRLLSLKSDLPVVIKRVNEGGATDSSTPIDKKEWDALSDFMRKVYKGGEDMKSYTKGGGIYDPEKKKKAEEDYKLLQRIAQAGDVPISKEDPAGLAGVLRKADAVMDDFFELLRDIPDEI